MKRILAIFGSAASVLALLAVSFVSVAHADTTQAQGANARKPVASEPGSNVDLTIYGSRGAQVQESRTVTLTAGPNKIQLNGIASQYRNDSLRVINASGPGTFTYKSATYQPANLTPERILVDYLGKEIEVYQRTGTGEWVKGKLLTGSLGQVTLQLASGEVRVINSTDLRVPQAPAGLSNSSALVIEADVAVAGDYKITFAYETNSVGWAAKHTVVFDDSNSRVENWKTTVSIVNNSGVTFSNATVRLISGAVLDGEGGAGLKFRSAAAPAMADMQSESASVESVGDQKTYNLPGTVELVNGQSRQVVLFEGRDIDVVRTYFVPQFGGDNGKQENVSVRLTVKNAESNNMGSELPAGPVKIYQYNAAGVQLQTGSAQISDKAKNEKFDMVIGTASDIKYTRTLISSKRFDAQGNELVAAPRPNPTKGVRANPAPVAVEEPARQDDTYEVKVFNYKETRKVTVKVEVYLPNDQTVEKPLVQKNARQAEGVITVNAASNATLEYTITTNLK